MTFKCPHCNGFIEVTGIKAICPDSEPKMDDPLVNKLLQWLSEPVTLSDLLLDYGCDGDLSRFEPLDREVVRTAFRSIDAVRELGLSVPSQKLRYIVQGLPGWANETAHTRVFGVHGRWWFKRGHEHGFGFTEPDDDLV